MPHPLRSKRVITLLILLAGLFLAISVSVAGGFLDFLVEDGRIDRKPAIACLATYWAVSSLGVLILGFALRYWREFLLLFGSVIMAVGLSEAVLRFLSPPWAMQRLRGVSSRTYHHLYPPERSMFMGVYDGHPVVIRTNEDGLRSGYTRKEFGKYRDRVVVIGDSFVFGYGIRQDRSLTVIMERLLREHFKGSAIAVLNAGIVSHSPFLSRLLLEGKLKHYHPTLVVLLLDTSDIGDDIKYQAEARVAGDRTYFDLEEMDIPYYGAVFESVRPLVELAGHYAGPILAQLAHAFPASRTKKYNYYRFSVKIGDRVESSRFFIYRYPLERTRPYFSRTLDNINAIAGEVERAGARFVLAVNPRFHHWNPREAPNNWEKFDYALDEPYQYEYFRFFEEARAEVHYPIFSLLPAFQKTDQFPLVFDNDPHWNEAGHEFAAHVLVNYLIENGMIAR